MKEDIGSMSDRTRTERVRTKPERKGTEEGEAERD